MPFAAALSTQGQTAPAVDEVCSRALEGWSGAPDLAVLFFSPHHAEAAESMVTTIREQLAPRHLLGCSGESIIGNDQEIEQRPALSLWLGNWNDAVRIAPFHLALEETPDGVSVMGWPDELTGADPAQSVVLLLGDPFTFPTDHFLTRMNEDAPGVPVRGGMASGITGAGDCRLLLDGVVHDQGAVGVLLEGEVGLRWIVSQGCRPIGRPRLSWQLAGGEPDRSRG